MSKILKKISDVVLILAIVVLSAYFVLRLANVIRIYSVETGSMEDKIHAGDYILLFRKNNYHVGDVVTYQVKKYFVTHRIVKIENDKITTKGDANNSEDAEINKSQIEGKVIYWGGALNFIINYKYVVIAFLLGMYLLSCYFGEDEESSKKKAKKKTVKNIEHKEKVVIDDIKEETKEKVYVDVDDEKYKPKKKQVEVLKDTKEEKNASNTKTKSSEPKTNKPKNNNKSKNVKKTTTKSKSNSKKNTKPKTKK